MITIATEAEVRAANAERFKDFSWPERPENGDPISHTEQADCMAFMARFPDKFFDLAIVDPPYGIGIKGENVIRNKGDPDGTLNTSWDISPDSAYFLELARVSREQIIWGGNHFLDILGFCKAPIIWDKLNGDSLYADGEMAWTSRGLPRNLAIFRHQWCGAFKDSERKERKFHPTQKPVALYKWLLTRYAKPGWKILDTHLGSGSSRIAAWDLGHDFWATELDADYFEAEEARFAEHRKHQFLFDREEIAPPAQQELF